MNHLQHENIAVAKICRRKLREVSTCYALGGPTNAHYSSGGRALLAADAETDKSLKSEANEEKGGIRIRLTATINLGFILEPQQKRGCNVNGRAKEEEEVVAGWAWRVERGWERGKGEENAGARRRE